MSLEKNMKRKENNFSIVEQEKDKSNSEFEKYKADKEKESNKFYEEIQKLIKINEKLEDEIKLKDQMEETLNKTVEKLDITDKELIQLKTLKTKLEEENDRIKEESNSQQIWIKEFQDKIESIGEDSKSEIKEKELKIEHLMTELSNYKDHMAKSLDLIKISHSNDLKEIQQKYEQSENEK